MRLESSQTALGRVDVGWFSSQRAVSLSPKVAPRARPFAFASATQAIQALWDVAPFAWVNDPLAGRRARDKLRQLVVARGLGFPIPESLLTNDPKRFRAFHAHHGSVAAKSHGGGAGLPEGDRITTSKVTPADVRNADSARYAPVLFQEYVEKEAELRVTVVGRECFVTEIDSQASPRTRVDWRYYDDGVAYTRGRLPRRVREACVRITSGFGLDYSGIDLVGTPTGEHVFLEVNSEPAWLWVEEKTGDPVTSAIAERIVARSRS